MIEYQSNYDINTSRKDDKISEVSNEIDCQDRNNVEIDNIKADTKQRMQNAFIDNYTLHI